jgi:hypothetical protein
MKKFKWENLQETALKHGQLVYAFDQERRSLFECL